jgi:hypothetical protein
MFLLCYLFERCVEKFHKTWFFYISNGSPAKPQHRNSQKRFFLLLTNEKLEAG